MQGLLAGPGTVLAGRYTIERELGRGGTATVYLADDSKHRRSVAVKILRPEIAATVGPERFLREIEIAARLTHPHILPLHDSGETGDFLYYVMPFVSGESLRDRMRREGKLPVEDAIRITCEVADALAYAHAQGFVHRDIKPGNILLESNHAVVADFGIARALSQAGGVDLTTSGLAIGTPLYMSPEQVAGGSVDGRSDVYSLGCVLYEMLAGEPPFTGPNPSAVAAQQLADPPPTLSRSNSSVPPHVSSAVRTALAKRPEERFPDATQFARALQGTQSGGVIRVLPRSRVLRRGALLLGAVAAIVLAGWWFTRYSSSSARQQAWILVADFEGPSQDKSLKDAVRELITAELDQSRHVATMPRAQLSAAMRDAGISDTLPLTADLARELAYRSSVRAILTGSVRRLGDRHYSIVVRVIDAEDGSSLLSAAEPATDADIVVKAQELGRQVRRGLGERRAEIESNKPLTQVATPSFEAYRKYADAMALANKGDVEGSNRLLHQALSLDSGFAAAWASMSVNYALARNGDSSRLALIEALKRPDRLNTAERYRLEAEAAYVLKYDLPAAVRWYQLHLEHDPQSISGHNNLGVYLASLGRYEDALQEFRTAARIDPFGPAQAQIQLFNESVMLLALGQDAPAAEVAGQLTGPFQGYASILLASAANRWSAVESLAAAAAAAPESPPWLKTPARTMWAGSMAARGAVTAADQMLRSAAAAAQGAQARWYYQAELLLALASGRGMAALPPAMRRDTTAGGVMLQGLTAAVRGEAAEAGRSLERLRQLPPVERLRLGAGPHLLEAMIAAQAGQWPRVTQVLAPSAGQGEHDGSSPDQAASITMRWLVGDAYERSGKLDSAAVYFRLATTTRRVPFSHLALRGMAFPFAERRLANLHHKMRNDEEALRHWTSFKAAFRTPDPDLRSLASATGPGP
jgi:eukaryotic-like serine/threonine-protein kinase